MQKGTITIWLLTAVTAGLLVNNILLILIKYKRATAPITYTQEEVTQMIAEAGYRGHNDSYNQGYKEGMLYAYDNIVVCGASPEDEGVSIARILGKPTEVSDIFCTE